MNIANMQEFSKKDNGVNDDETKAKNIDPNKNIDYDQLLSSAGEFGLYQVYLFFLTCPFYIFGAFSYFSQVFMTERSQDHWCWLPELANLTELERKTLAIPVDDNSPFGYMQCKSYLANWTEVLISGQKPNSTWTTVPCQHGWEFNDTEIPYPTISSELGWVCEQQSYQATAQSFFFVGSMVGGLIVGWIADRFGRIPALVFSNLIGCVAGVATAFTRTFIEFTVCRFFTGMSYDNCMMMSYLIILEYVAPKYRTMMTNLSLSIFFTIGVCSLPWIALACGDWRTISLATSIPFGLALLVPFVMPESPRWLLSKGRIDDAVNKVLTIGRINKKPVPSKLVEQFKLTVSQNNKDSTSRSIIDLLKIPSLRRMFLCMCLEYLCSMIVFDSLVRTIGQLKFDFFISFTVISFTEFPSIFLLSFILDWFGRKWLTMLVMLVCSLFSCLIPFVGAGLPSVLCAVVARFGVNMALNSCMQWAAEMLPTPVRGSGTSIVHICSYMAMIISPFVPNLAVYAPWLPNVVVGCVSLIAVLLCFALPETAKREMPETFDDAENLIQSQGMWDFPWLKKHNSTGHVIN